jgi:CRISPR/Cas system-associated endonuclease Cas1
MHTLQNTLYVMTPQAYAHLENATVRIDVEREKRLQVPLHQLSGLVNFGNILLRQAQHKAANDPAVTLEHARACVAFKLKNSRVNLQRGAREAADAEEGAQLTRSADNLAASLRVAAVATTLDEMRCVEGARKAGHRLKARVREIPAMRRFSNGWQIFPETLPASDQPRTGSKVAAGSARSSPGGNPRQARTTGLR